MIESHVLEVRLAEPWDLPRIVEIYNSSIPGRLATADTEPVTVDQRRAWFAAHDAASYPIAVAEQQGQVIGWQSFGPFYGRPAYRATAEVSLYVAAEHQRRGVGRRLLGHAVEQATYLQFRTLLAFIFGHNLASLRLFGQFGFQQWGLLPQVAEMDQHRYDLVILGRDMAP